MVPWGGKARTEGEQRVCSGRAATAEALAESSRKIRESARHPRRKDS